MRRNTVAYLLAFAFHAAIASGFILGVRSKSPSFVGSKGASTEESSGANANANANEPERTLYDVLDASPNDSQQALRRKYTDAARRTHPDAAKSGKLQGENDMADFREIAAAWSVLSDPKERKRYDRSLKAKELTENVGSLIDTGFNVAVPFLFETAPQQINKTASDIGKTISDVGERLDKARTEAEQRLERARKVAGLKQKSGDIARRATGETKRAEALKARLYSDRRLEALRGAETELTSAQASQIIKGFDFLEDTGNSNIAVMKTIDALAQVEGDHKEKSSMYQGMKVSLSEAEKKMEATRQERQLAEEGRENSFRNLEEAKVHLKQAEKDYKDAVQQERQIVARLDATKQNMDSAKDDERVAKELLEEARRRFEKAQTSRLETEKIHNEAVIEKQQATKRLDSAQRREDSARLDEKLSEDRLEESRRRLEEAKTSCEISQSDHKEVVLQEKEAATSLDNASAMLKRKQFEARQALRQAEGLNTSKENSYLKDESKRLEDLAAKLRAKAEKLSAKAEKIKAEAE